MKNTSPLLAIRCLAYNHEPYIRQCLEGFVMQKTDFPFVAIVHDDASTDKTADIIREYEAKYPDSSFAVGKIFSASILLYFSYRASNKSV